ncbi:MAG: NADH:flavin oxidoreductase [Deltaproteobacteria bacterium]|nr:NADH:flavin oxidoreductase [Deltaproteobacteria bacterium]
MSILFTPAKIGPLELKNRFVRSATVECLASEDNRLTEKYYNVYERLAKGGVGLIIPGNYFVNSIGRAADKVLVIDRDDVIDDLRKLTDIVHRHDAKIIGQINHSGRQGNPKLIGEQPISPSDVRDATYGGKPRQMTELEIEDTIHAFGSAAGRIKKAGFDGVQINGAHGYLVNQFLSSHTNRRTDQWGGPLENRMRFISLIYEEIRKEVGADFPVLIKINCEDEISGGITLEESIAMSRMLEALGFNAIEVSGGIYEAGFVTTKGDIPAEVIGFMAESLQKAAAFKEGYFLPQAAAIKQNVSIPIIAVGGMRRRETMERALLQGQTDLIALSRPFIRQPNLVRQMERSPDADPINCTNCNRCTWEVTVRYKPLKCYYTSN